MSITIKHTLNDRILCTTPFHPDFAARAKKLGGRWEPSEKSWRFDRRDEAAVRALCIKLFGTDGSPETAADVLTIRAPLKVCHDDGTALWLAGRQVARVVSRDGGARLGDGVVVLRGSIGSGGSMKNPRIVYKDGTIVELRDVPRALAETVHGEFHGVDLLDGEGAVVLAATHAEEPPPAVVATEPSEADVLTVEIAAAIGRLAGLRFRAAEIAAS